MEFGGYCRGLLVGFVRDWLGGQVPDIPDCILAGYQRVSPSVVCLVVYSMEAWRRVPGGSVSMKAVNVAVGGAIRA